MAEQEPRDDAADRTAGGRTGGRPPRARDAASRKPSSTHRGGASASGARDDRGRNDRKPYEKKPYGSRDGDRKPYEKKPYEKKPYEKKPYEKKPYEKKPYGSRDGDKKPYEKKPYGSRDGDRKPYEKKPYEKRDGERKPYVSRDGDRKPYEKKPYGSRDGDRKPYEKKPYGSRDGDRKPYQQRDGGRAGHRGGRPTRGGADRPDRATRPEEIRQVRARHDDPVIPDEITARDLHPSARNELKTLSKENAEQVARHLVMASELIDDDPALAHQHAISASRRAGRIAIVRETLAITAYATEDYALALRELRTYRRISGKDDQIALMVDSERGVGRPDRALEVGRGVDRASLPTEVRVGLAIAMSGARLDLGQPERALQELDIPELDPDRAFEWSPALFAARATVLDELGQTEEAARWRDRADVAAEAIDGALRIGDLETVVVDEIIEIDIEDEDDDSGAAVARTVTQDDHAAPRADDAGDAASAVISVEDEVADILIEAGVDDAPGQDSDGEGSDR